jgi:hypothetical protein
MFSGGSYDDVARWLKNFLASHAKREEPRIEVELDTDDEREGASYGARLRLEERVTPTLEFAFSDVAANRGNLAWCLALAARIRHVAREQLLGATITTAR